MVLFGKFVIAIADLLAIFCIGMSLYFSFMYLVDIDNPLRHEFGLGVGFSFIYGLGPALFALIVSIIMRNQLSLKFKIVSISLFPLLVFCFGMQALIEI